MPKVASENMSRGSPRPAPTVGPAKRSGAQRFEHFPLLAGQVHAPPPLKDLDA
jgi:hypothetical protein